MATQREEWQSHHRKQLAYEAEWRGRALYALRAQKRPFITAAIEQPWIIGLPPELINTFLDQYIKPDPLLKLYNRLYGSIAPKEGESYLKQQEQAKEQMLGFGQSQTWLNTLQEWLRTWLAAQISQMTDYTKRVILAAISQGLQNGDSYDQIIKQIQSLGLDRVRAAAIARTETNRALGWAKYEAIKRLPYPARVVWVAARDKRTRGAEVTDKADHFDLNGQMQEWGEPFTDIRSGAKMLFPGDVSMGAGAGDVINCRCTIMSKRIR